MNGSIDGLLSITTLFEVVALLSVAAVAYRLKGSVHSAWQRRRQERQRERVRRDFWGFD